MVLFGKVDDVEQATRGARDPYVQKTLHLGQLSASQSKSPLDRIGIYFATFGAERQGSN